MSLSLKIPFESLYLEPSRNGLTRPKRERGSGYKMINMGELFAHDRINNPPMDLVPMSESEIARFGIKQGDLLFARQSLVAEGAGKCSIVLSAPEVTTFESHLIRVRLDPAIADPAYFYYYFSSPAGKANVQSLVMQVAAAGIRSSELATLPVPKPNIAQQRRIASILSAYDDLIENNTRRIAILEEMARRIYEEWFVRFRFPGHEGVRMVDSDLGPIPESWKVVRLDEVLVLQRGFDLPKQDRTEGPFPIISATGGNATHHECRVRGPGVVTGRSGSLGTVIYVENDFWPLNTTLWVKKFVVGSALYSFYLLKTIDLAGFNSGAAVPTLNRNDIHGLPVVRPSPDVLARFDEVVLPMMKLKRRLELMNQNLGTTRDLLLPKLISGELDVSAMPAPESIAA
jgi:type I restriction enzyme, S subunit